MASLSCIGYEVVRQKGSHVRLRHSKDASYMPMTVSDDEELKSGTLRAFIRNAGLTVEQFNDLLK